VNIVAQWKHGTGSIAPLLAEGPLELEELYGILEKLRELNADWQANADGFGGN